MPSLHETQRAIARALFDGQETGIDAILLAGGLSASDRVSIYRNNLRAGFHKALALDFPVVGRLVGQEFFRDLALEFLAVAPSRSGDLHHVGRAFPDFLRARFAGSRYEYLADVAQLERAHSEVLLAPEAQGIDLLWLAAVPPVDYHALRFRLDPACRLLRSAYPIVRIWLANQPDSDDTALIDLEVGGDCVLVCRVVGQVQFHRLEPLECTFLSALEAGEGLQHALEHAMTDEADFDLPAFLRRLAAVRAINAWLPPAMAELSHANPNPERP